MRRYCVMLSERRAIGKSVLLRCQERADAVPPDERIDGYQCETFDLRLRNQHAIERIAVERRKTAYRIGMPEFNRQRTESGRFQFGADADAARDSQLSRRRLDRNLPGRRGAHEHFARGRDSGPGMRAEPAIAFEMKIHPSDTDLNAVRTGIVPRLWEDYTFNQELDKTSNSVTVVLPGGEFAGLYAIRDNWRLRTTATPKIDLRGATC